MLFNFRLIVQLKLPNFQSFKDNLKILEFLIVIVFSRYSNSKFPGALALFGQQVVNGHFSFSQKFCKIHFYTPLKRKITVGLHLKEGSTGVQVLAGQRK